MLLLQHVDGLLGLGVHVLQQLPQLGHLGLAPPVQVGLALAAALGLRQPLAQAQDLEVESKGLVQNVKGETTASQYFTRDRI